MAEEGSSDSSGGRKFQKAFLDGQTLCKLCYETKRFVKFYMPGSGLQQHFRVMHRERYTEKIETDCKLLFKTMHGEETSKFLAEFTKSRADAVSIA